MQSISLTAGLTLRMAFRAALMEQALEQGMTHPQAIRLVERLHVDGILAKQTATLEALLDSVVRAAVQNHAHAVVLVERCVSEAHLEAAGYRPVPIDAPLNRVQVNQKQEAGHGGES